MPVDLLNETLIAFSSAPKKLPGRPSLATMHRWRRKGLYGITLETVLIGNVCYTTREAFSRFVAALNAARNSEPAQHRTNRQRAKQQGDAEKVLAKVGI